MIHGNIKMTTSHAQRGRERRLQHYSQSCKAHSLYDEGLWPVSAFVLNSNIQFGSDFICFYMYFSMLYFLQKCRCDKLDCLINNKMGKPSFHLVRTITDCCVSWLILLGMILLELCFSALCGPNEQKFGELLTWPEVITPSKFLPNLFTESWETQHLKGKKHKPKFEFRTLLIN